MSLAADQFAVAVPALLAQHGDTVVYTPPDGGPKVSLTAILSFEERDAETDDQGLSVYRRLRASIPRTSAVADSGNYVSDPSPRGTITWESVEYAIVDEPDGIVLDPSMAHLRLQRREWSEKSRPQYRERQRS